MYRLINDYRDAICLRLADLDIAAYGELMKALQSRGADATTSPHFQAAYRRYWRMNVARLGDLYYRRYFELLADCWVSQSTDIEAIVRDLAETLEARTLQFSFATKLAHMVNPRLPVFDSFVAAFYFYTPPASSNSFDQRLGDLLTFYRFLQAEYDRVTRDPAGSRMLAEVRNKLSLDLAVPDERVLDWLIWGLVSLLRERARQRVEIQYRI